MRQHHQHNKNRDFLTKRSQAEGCVVACPCGSKKLRLFNFASAVAGKVLILRDLMPGTKRFGELKKSIGSVSQKVLTAQLRDMEENGLVNRKVYAEVPPRVEYSLTELGQSLKPILDAMWSWGEDYKEKCNK